MDKEVSFAEIVSGKSVSTERGIDRREHNLDKQFHALFVKSIDTEKRQITAYASTGTLDRFGDIVEPESFRETMPQYMKNPIIVVGHQHRLESGHSPVVANVIKWWIDKIGLGVIIEFARGTELADEYWLLYSQKIQRAFSIGFSILESHSEERDGSRVNIITKVELYEISCVPVPANPDALSKSKQRKLDFVNSKRQEKAEFDEEKFIEQLRADNPNFDDECEIFAKVIYGIDDENQEEEIPDDYFAKMVSGE